MYREAFEWLYPALTPIVAIHGSASSGGLWDPLAQHTSGQFAVFAPDLSGYGPKDPKVADPRSTLRQRAEPIVQHILKARQSVHLVAHSFGASVALEIVRRVSWLIKSITIYEPVVPTLLRDSGEPDDLTLLGDLLALAEMINGTQGPVGMETFIDFWSGANTWSRLPAPVKAGLADSAPVVYQDFVEAHHNATAESIGTIKYDGPIKILQGAQTNTHAKRMTTLMHQQFIQSSVQTLQNMGHMGPLTHADQVSPLIMSHIKQVEMNDSYQPNAASPPRKNKQPGGNHEIL